jgi:SOS response regulatory protein OraA/RecX
METIVATIQAMRLQEQRAYICQDYLYQQEHEEAQLRGPLSKQAVTNDCREKMVQWCYKVRYIRNHMAALKWDLPRHEACLTWSSSALFH